MEGLPGDSSNKLQGHEQEDTIVHSSIRGEYKFSFELKVHESEREVQEKCHEQSNTKWSPSASKFVIQKQSS